MSTLAVVEQVLRDADAALSVRDIVKRAGRKLPTRSRTPETVVARDLSMDIKVRGEASLFVRTAPGRYGLRVKANETDIDGPTSATESLGAPARTKPASADSQTSSSRTQPGNSAQSA